MLLIRCDACGRDHLVGTRAVLEIRPTDTGPEALVRCPAGHHVLWHARTETSRLADAVPAAA